MNGYINNGSVITEGCIQVISLLFEVNTVVKCIIILQTKRGINTLKLIFIFKLFKKGLYHKSNLQKTGRTILAIGSTKKYGRGWILHDWVHTINQPLWCAIKQDEFFQTNVFLWYGFWENSGITRCDRAITHPTSHKFNNGF